MINRLFLCAREGVYVKVEFSIDIYDQNGEIVEEGIYLHFSNGTILRFETLKELNSFKNEIYDIISEIEQDFIDDVS
jgi:hypothetical protein